MGHEKVAQDVPFYTPRLIFLRPAAVAARRNNSHHEQARLPVWVMSGGLEVGQSLPVYPNKLTISEPSRTSREDQKPKWMFWGCSLQTDVACP
ncbi:hypothetical protein ABIB94_004901 [Bradyrhizobium sp. JR7.2]|uniref:hypothetical protein n=1 Tax=Bradyrhizobium TaxID=374 RepID=UPI0011816DF4|nr:MULTISPECIES: hypothetical protein [Bradyrhizobium]WFT93323.1 hypothetical protein QA633_34210 [Bradyrhizobium barranii]